MNQDHISKIKNHFRPWSDIECWVLSNDRKQPCTIHSGEYVLGEEKKAYSLGDMLRWREEPQDHITTLNRVLSVLEKMPPSYGFGVILSHKNNILCFDFDHALENGEIKNLEVKEFVSVVSSFTEISSSGNGLHVFVDADVPEDYSIDEYGFKEQYGDGKFYDARFIKMTGNCLDNFDVPVRVLNRHELDTIKRKISAEYIPPVFKKATRVSSSNDELNWDEILSEVGIIHTKTNYANKTKDYGNGISKLVLESYRIPCPNRLAHTDYYKRERTFGPDAAILNRWDDGTTSITCNHNACKPESHPNLLLKLWDEIRKLRVDDANNVISKYKGIL